MKSQRKLNSYLIILVSCLLLLSSAPLSAQTTQRLLLNWLPFLTSNIKRIQPNQSCPQNQLLNIQASHKQNKLNTDIGVIDWDLNCPAAQTDKGSTKQLPFTLQKGQIDLQLNELFKRLAALPETNIRIKSLNLATNLLHKKLSFSVFIKKKEEHLFITLSGEQLKADLKINLLNKDVSVESRIDLEQIAQLITLPVELNKLLHDELKVSYTTNLKSWGKGAFTLNWQGSLPDLAKQGQLSLAGDINLLADQLAVSQLAINLQNVNYSLSTQQEWKTRSISLKLAQPALINLSSLQIHSLPLQLRVGRSALLTKTPRGKMQRIHIDTQKLPSLFASIDAQGSVDHLSLDWRLSLLNQTLAGKLLYADKKIKVELPDTHLSPQTLVESLHSYLPATELLQIKSGEINLQLSAWYDLTKNSTRVASHISAHSVAGENSNVLFDGISLNSELDYLFEKEKVTVNTDKLQLKIANLFVGIPIQALQLDAQINIGEPLVQHFKARLLGGRVDFDDFTLAAPSQTLINLSGLSLSEVVKYSAYPEIESTAIIDGVLPLSLTAQGPTISNGTISARAPGGYIKVPENSVTVAMGQVNPAVAYTMQLLSDFQFDTLQGTIGYTADGECDLKIAIKGINPNVSGTQPINFNYSHNENILQLLKSLRFNEQLVQQIKERY
ncbi:MAG: hypothetical protein ACJAT7_000195 [Psychromonas sp.]|uniref:intermembrane phospholipid transport protein YdbH family protein n=1 Tax=Psychromonas sp. TaxID=1884585 RepID=UPI0039E3B25F